MEPSASTLSVTLDGPSLTVQGRTVVVVPAYIDLAFRDGNEDVIIGRVRAEFDFSQVPAEFHVLLLNHLARAGQIWAVGAIAQRRDYDTIERLPRVPALSPPTPVQPWWSFLTRWFRW